MVTAAITRNRQGLVCEYRSQGHAGDAPHGENLVCAAVSAMEQMALAGLTEHLKRPVDYHMDEADGSLLIRLTPDAQTEILMETLCIMVKQLQKQYPEYVQMVEHRR